MTPIDLATNTPGSPIKVGSAPESLAITPDGKTVYVSNTGYTNKSFVEVNASVTPIATATNKVGASIPFKNLLLDNLADRAGRGAGRAVGSHAGTGGFRDSY